MELTDILTEKCIEKFNAVKNPDDNGGSTQISESLIIYHVIRKTGDNGHMNSENISAHRYSDGNITEIPADTLPDNPPERIIYKEAFAKFGYDENSGKAFINIYFGKRFSSGFEYDIVTENNDTKIINEKKRWVS